MFADPHLARVLSLLLALLLASCGGDDGSGGGGSSDAGVPPADAPASDLAPGDTSTGRDTAAAADLPPDTAETAGGCAEGPSCVDELGAPSLGLCPKPVTDWRCEEGCCVPRFHCATDQDCREHGRTEGFCPDERFDCRCEAGSGACFSWTCAVSGDCEEGEICHDGVCGAPPANPSPVARILNRTQPLLVGSSLDLVVEVRDGPRGPLLEGAAVEVSIEVAPAGALTASGLELSAVGPEATAEVRVRSTEAEDPAWSDPLVLQIVGAPAAKGLVVAVTDTFTGQPVPGATVLWTDATTGVEGGNATTDDRGVASFDGSVTLPVDVHVIPLDHAAISVMKVQDRALHVVTPRSFLAKIHNNEDLSVTDDGEQVLEGGDLIVGEPDFSKILKGGEFELSVQSFELRGTGVFAFDLPVILGPDVKQYLAADSPLPVSGTNELPGGISLSLGGKPVSPFYYLAGPAGQRTLWGLGGRIAGNELSTEISEIVGAAVGGGDIDFNRIVSALFPLFSSFHSGVVHDISLKSTPTWPVRQVDMPLDFPLSLRTSLMAPDLPKLGEGSFMDLMVFIPGALRADGSFVPLGINAGTDRSNDTQPVDGKVDGLPKTLPIDPFSVPYAFAHSGLDGPAMRYAMFVVAASINPGGKSAKPETGSGWIYVAAPGKPLPEGPLANVPELLPSHVEAAWESATRTLTFAAASGVTFYRVVLRAGDGRDWHLILAPGSTSLTLPAIDAWLPAEIAGKMDDPKELVLNAFELRGGLTRAQVLDLDQPDHGLDTLFFDVLRSSYINVKP